VNPWLLAEFDDQLDEEDTTDYENLSYEEPDAAGGTARQADAGEREAPGATPSGER